MRIGHKFERVCIIYTYRYTYRSHIQNSFSRPLAVNLFVHIGLGGSVKTCFEEGFFHQSTYRPFDAVPFFLGQVGMAFLG